MKATTARIELPPKLVPVFAKPLGALRYRGAYGGRGSGKSYSFALMAAVFGYQQPLRILCTRELQNSMKESMFAEIKNAIQARPWLAQAYAIGENYIKGHNGTEFIFRGLRHNMSSIKSTAHIDICIVEEAEDVPEASWIDLEPTIRAENSEIWVVWNPRAENSPVDTRFRKNIPERSIIVEMNYHDNPKFPSVLEEQRRQAQRNMEDAMYQHVWLGAYLKHSKAQIFANKFVVEPFAPGADWDGPYLGLDFGFAQDPTAAVKCWIHNQRLYIEAEAGGVGVELDDTAELIRRKMPEIGRYTVRADNARPESISYLKRNGIPGCKAVSKGKGSVEDGVEFIKSFDRVVIHPDCKEVANEFRMYSYKVDRLTGDIMPVIVDAHNHYIDAIRYALEPMIKSTGLVFAC